jgi:cyclic beta-1,2-glucan synthetase
MAENIYLGSCALALGSSEQELQQAQLAANALDCARGMVWVPGTKTSRHFAQRVRRLGEKMQAVFAATANVARFRDTETEQERWIRDNVQFLRAQIGQLHELRDGLRRTVHVRLPNREVAPRPLIIAEHMLASLEYRLDDAGFYTYLHSFQCVAILRLGELWDIIPAMKLVLLEHIAEMALQRSGKKPSEASEAETAACISSLRAMKETPWKELLEPLIVFDDVLRRDPAGAYARMDDESRDMYRREVVKLAEHSGNSELEVAELAISLARQSLRVHEPDSRLALRRSHVGYYLIAEGRELLCRRADIRLPLRDRLRGVLLRYPDEFYLSGIEILTLAMILTVLWWINFGSLWGAFFAAAALLIPCSQSALEIMNHVTTSLLQPRILPKLDFASSIPEDRVTMVVVPMLLLNEKQVRQLVKELEVRYVGNMSANLHFALLTDLADSAEQPREDDPLVDLCGGLIRELNRKYAGNGCGTFSMFHRHRVYNHREGVWMGWERKRGKLLDFNKLILGEYDSFPYKAGVYSVLPKVRYVLTLDSDTELPRGTAARLIGTLAHPLGQAIIDRKLNIVVHGFGILQPRVGISVQSAARSRLASIYSGRTGFDIYTRATSDVYQDLYGEGTFVGKGLYEVRTVHRVLDQRFPRNSILSHDLIEGAYCRAALVSDVEVIDHYPSHYSAYIRRKHRWVRGDWQTIEWLFSRVRDERGRRVPNPISVISRWKILDNLRRSIVEPATLALFLVAWAILPGRPLYWTLVPLAILFAPTAFQFSIGLLRAALGGGFAAAKDECASVATGLASVLLSVTFLLHDALVSMDAIWRSLYRRSISRQRLLQWETAAESEVAKKKRTHLDLYLLSTPVIALTIGVWLLFTYPGALWVAFPILVLWGSSKLISLWLDRPPRREQRPDSRKDELFLRAAALRTWRYFAELSTDEHNWLVPDNLQADPQQVAARVSPTNLGFLLNARQVACELGYLSVPEFVEQTRRTLDTMDRLRRYKGHLLNWYDTRTLAPLEPQFVSTVDSGNLAASLISLQSGCSALLEKPLPLAALINGYEDHLRALANLKALSKRKVARSCRSWKRLPLAKCLFGMMFDPLAKGGANRTSGEALWFAAQLGVRRERLQEVVSEYMPWLLPEFESIRCIFSAEDGTDVPLAQLPEFIEKLQTKLRNCVMEFSGADRENCEKLLILLTVAYARSVCLIRELTSVACDAERWFSDMDFTFLLNCRRKLLSIGYDLHPGKQNPACYDLLASEARIATFIAIAKGDIPQDVWFKLGRAHAHTRGGSTLVSWTGTMFEYLMPAIWMKSYPDTLLQRSMESAVNVQREYAAQKRVPWGISESGYSETDEAGTYKYRAFGVPALALQSQEEPRIVIAPYATAISLAVDNEAAVRNLRRIFKYRWFGKYGFFEAVDFGADESSRRDRSRIVNSWMAHHQGMTLLSIANFLCGNVVRRWFHDDVRVQATELLLQERAVVRRIRPIWHISTPAVSLRTPAAPGKQLAFES